MRRDCALLHIMVEHFINSNATHAYRRRYVIPDFYDDAIRKQVQKWIENRVIELAPPNTAFNSPLFYTKKKNAKTGEYSTDPDKI
jgi:hypothetical protein